jgi:hypothetical protein
MDNINSLNDGPWGWFTTDILAVAASDGNAIFTFTNSSFSSVTQYGGGGGGGVTPAQVQQSVFNLAIDTSVGPNAYTASLTPPTAALTDGLVVYLLANNDNTIINPTFNLDGHGAKQILIGTNTPLAFGDIKASGTWNILQYSAAGSGIWELINPFISYQATFLQASGEIIVTFDTGTANNYAGDVNLYPNSAASSIAIEGCELNILVAHDNTGNSTFSFGGLTPTQIVDGLGNALTAGAMKANFFSKLILLQNGKWQLLNSDSSSGAGAFNYGLTYVMDRGIY